MPITSVNMKRNQEIEDEHSAITRDENEPKAGFSFARSVRESILPSVFSNRPRSFVARSVRLKSLGKYIPVQTSHSDRPYLHLTCKLYRMRQLE